MEKIKKSVPIAGVLLAGIIGLSAFGITTGLFSSPLILIGITLFLLFPYRRSSYLIRRLIILAVILFTLWLLGDMGFALLPFALSFFIAYLLDPLVSKLQRGKFPRWLAALLIILILVGLTSAVSILIFPTVFSQLDSAIKQASSLVNSVTSFLESRKFYRMLSDFGLPQDKMKEIMQSEFMPKLEALFATILQALLSLLTGLSGLASQLINVILLPILTFYFVKDMPALKNALREVLQDRNKKILFNLERINSILRKYIGWQVLAAIMIGAASSALFALFGVPYPVVLGILCGLLNPIPIFGSLSSMLIAIVTVLLANPADVWTNITIIVLIINGLHFINAYVIEPRILGSHIGLHPIVLLASLFVFGHFFGFLGLLTAVPTTAILMMFYKDWATKANNTQTNPPVDISTATQGNTEITKV